MARINTASFYLLLLFITALSGSCVNLAKRFKSYDNQWLNWRDASKYVEVSAKSYPVPESPKTTTSPKDIFILSPEGQAELIKAVASKTDTSVNSLIKGITSKLPATTSETARVRVFPTVITKSIQFTVDKKWYSEGKGPNYREMNRIADRLSNLQLSVDVAEQTKVKFNWWDKFVTDWVTVDLGKVASSQQWSATANINASLAEKMTNTGKTTTTGLITKKTGKADIGQSEDFKSDQDVNDNSTTSETNASIGPSANVNITDKYESSINLLMSRMKLSGTLSENRMVLRQEGAFGVDLSGNTSISVDFKYVGDYAPPIYVYKFQKYYNANGVVIQPKSLIQNRVMWVFPDMKETVKGKIEYSFLYRYVRTGTKKHLPEARQKVIYFHGEVESNIKDTIRNDDGSIADYRPLTVDLAKPEDFKPATFRISTGFSGDSSFVTWDKAIIEFESATEAASFIEYLNTLSQSTTTNYSSIGNIAAVASRRKFLIIKYQH